MANDAVSAAAIQQQQELLRQIRDEIRTGRMESGGRASAVPGGPAAPSGAIVRMQAQADRMLSSEWSTFGWAHAYRSEITSSLASDVMGAWGGELPPNSMNYNEYEAYSRESLGLRAQRFTAGWMAPGSMRRTNALASEIYRYSPRFLRSGDANASFMGTGMSRTQSRYLARDIEYAALGDMRMSFDDYSSVAVQGMRSGQFDFTESADAFASKLKELATVTGDLTRVTRMSVDEVAQSMGALRQFGVADSTDQARIIRQISSSARVAGLSTGQMMGLAQDAIASGIVSGIGAEASAGMISSGVAATRTMTRSGLLSTHAVAAGGGVEGINRSIDQARRGFLSSSQGYFALRGGLGRGRGTVGAFASALGDAGGFEGILAAQMGRLDYMEGMGADQLDAAYRGHIETQLQMLGVIDFTSDRAQAMAFGILRGQMGEPAALAYSRQNFSREGRMATEGSRLQIILDDQSRVAANEMSKEFEMNSFGGRFAQMGIGIKQTFASVRNTVADAFTPDYVNDWGPGRSRMEHELRMYSTGGLVNKFTSEQLADAYRETTPSMSRSLVIQNRNPDAKGFGPFGQLTTGMATGATIGTFLGGPLGTVAGGILGAGAAMGIGIFGGTFSPETQTLRGEDVINYQRMLAGYGSNTSSRARDLLSGAATPKGSSVFADHEFQEVMANLNKGALSASGSQTMMEKFTRIAGRTGEDVDTLMSLAKAGGLRADFAGAQEFLAGDVTVESEMATLFNGITDDFNYMRSDNLAAVQKMIEAEAGGDLQARMQATQDLQSRDLSSDSIQLILDNAKGMGTGRLSKALSVAAGKSVNASLQRHLGGVATYVEQVAGGDMNQAARKALEGTAQDRRTLLDIFAGGGGAGGQALRRALKDSGNSMFQTMLEIGEADLGSMNAQDMARKWRGSISSREANDIVAEVERLRSEGKDTDMAKRMALHYATGVDDMKRAGYEEDASREAVLLNSTSLILKQIASSVGAEIPSE
jgi:hypothetical protein